MRPTRAVYLAVLLAGVIGLLLVGQPLAVALAVTVGLFLLAVLT